MLTIMMYILVAEIRLNTWPVERRIYQSSGAVKVEAAVLGSLSLISLMVSVDVKQH